VNSYSILSSRYHWINVVQNWFSRPHHIILIALLGILSFGATGAKAQSASNISCQTSSFTSAGTDTCSVYLSSAAQSQVSVYLYSSDPALTLPGAVYVNPGASSVAFSANLASVSSARTVWITAQASTAMGSRQSYGIQLAPPTSNSSPAPQLSKIACQTASFSSAGTDTCSIYLSGNAQTQTLVNLSSSDPALTVPGAVYVNAGASSAAFSANLASVTSARTVLITAQTSGGGSLTYGIQLTPPASSPSSQLQLSKISCQTNSFNSAGTDICSASLSGTAQSQVSVYLYSSDPALTIPGAVYINAGASSVTFSANLASVTSARMVWITGQASTAMATKASCGIQLGASTGTQTPTQTPTLTVNATSIPFGSVNLNSKATQTVTLTSSGTAPVTVNSAVVTGNGFSMSGSSFPVTLNPGQTLNLNLQFVPPAAGSVAGQLTITSNSSTNPTANFALSGTGASGATSHQVDLTWSAPALTSDPVAGYNVYRAASGTTSFQRLNSSPVGSMNYTDSAVTSGQAYVYIVKSVDGAGTESASSNTSTATVPGD
jgi:Abnormal spindle-like microcephaly-assoc'd, ASPM-SPD-2-Hydin